MTYFAVALQNYSLERYYVILWKVTFVGTWNEMPHGCFPLIEFYMVCAGFERADV